MMSSFSIVKLMRKNTVGLYVTQTLSSSAIYPIVCLLLYTSQALALYQPEVRADRLCDISYFISAILDCLIGLLSVSRASVSITLH